MRSRFAALVVIALLLGSVLVGGCKKSGGSGGSGGYQRAPGTSAPAASA